MSRTLVVMLASILVLLLILLAAALAMRQRIRRKRRTDAVSAMAERERVAFWYDQSPIPRPAVEYSPPVHIGAMRNFLHGRRNGVEVYGCDFQIGESRAAPWGSVAGVRGEVVEPERLKSGRLGGSQWSVIRQNGWTFLYPATPPANPLPPEEIAGLWDAMIAAMRPRGS